MLNIYFVSLSYLLIATVCIKADNTQRCKSEYRFHGEVGGWLKLHKTPATWKDAFLTCHNEGAVLASPINRQLANALSLIVSRYRLDEQIYLGISDLHSSCVYTSVEGEPFSDLKIKWSGDYENGSCLTMTRHGDVYKSTCDQELPFICYKKLDPETLNKCGTSDNEYHFKQETGSCYKLHTEKQTWPSAYKTCAIEGAYLAIVNDQAEANVLQAMFPPASENDHWWEGFHIGLRAWGTNRTWITIHGQALDEVFHKWHPLVPDNDGGRQDRGSFLRTGDLDDLQPDYPAMFVCEKSPKSIKYY